MPPCPAPPCPGRCQEVHLPDSLKHSSIGVKESITASGLIPAGTEATPPVGAPGALLTLALVSPSVPAAKQPERRGEMAQRHLRSLTPGAPAALPLPLTWHR